MHTQHFNCTKRHASCSIHFFCWPFISVFSFFPFSAGCRLLPVCAHLRFHLHFLSFYKINNWFGCARVNECRLLHVLWPFTVNDRSWRRTNFSVLLFLFFYCWTKWMTIMNYDTWALIMSKCSYFYADLLSVWHPTNAKVSTDDDDLMRRYDTLMCCVPFLRVLFF